MARRAAKAAVVVDLREKVMSAVLEAMARGETVADASAALGHESGVVRRWFAADPEWQRRYREARTLQGQAMAEEAIRIARETTDRASAADRLLIETLKWAASKANPAEYGDRQTVEHQGNQQLQVKIVEEDGSKIGGLGAEGLVRALESAVLVGGQIVSSAGGDAIAFLPSKKDLS